MRQRAVYNTSIDCTLNFVRDDSRAADPRGPQPITVGVPFPHGLLPSEPLLRARTCDNATRAVQTSVLDRWPDGSPRWVLCDFRADVAAGARVVLEAAETAPSVPAMGERIGDAIAVRTGVAQFTLAPAQFPFAKVLVDDRAVLDPERTALVVLNADGMRCPLAFDAPAFEYNGPLRTTVRMDGRTTSGAALEITARLTFHAGRHAVLIELTLRNPQRATHPGGIWELGDRGSVLLRDVHLRMAHPSTAARQVVSVSEHPGAPLRATPLPTSIYQDSSGGEHWRGSVHVDRTGSVPMSRRGYLLTSPAEETVGLRATPLMTSARDGVELAVTMDRFWENFPKAMTADEGGLVLHLFPGQSAGGHEIQGGEQKTHRFWVSCGPGDDAEPLAGCRAPYRAVLDPAWVATTSAIPFLIPREDDPHAAYLALVDQAIEGSDSFYDKREAIDEYGWRHFGEVYADHEAVFHPGPDRLVSHYNNQYDPIAGCTYHFLRSGRLEWWALLDDLARHVVDIDIYHTDKDWAKYAHGMFWHTVHYIDAGRSTHRTYPKAEKVYGGGPSCGHLYTTGLMLHYFLTGSNASRDAAIELGGFVIDSDDGRQSIFRWFDSGPTGYATASGSDTYHGPGRAPGNALNALLDAHRLTGDSRFLHYADTIIRRCIHPDDDIAARNLLDAENRWFYTMFLQSLGKYLAHKRERGLVDGMFAYARASLLAYARWMAAHERPTLTHPEQLEYPTETWAAQDMRKSEVFKWAAFEATGEQRALMLERSRFFFDDSVRTLTQMPTRSLARPVILLMAFGWSHAAFETGAVLFPATTEMPTQDFGSPTVFVPQRVRAVRRAKVLAIAAAAVCIVVTAVIAATLWNRF